MNQAKILIASAAAAAVSLGFSLQPHQAPFWETNIVIAGEESVQGTPTEKDTQKIDQPPPQNPTTGQQ
jgi:hypothetical protein